MSEYLIKIDAITDCWVADIDGDPGRTVLKINAKRYPKLPVKEISELARKYPNRTFSAEPETKQDPPAYVVGQWSEE